MKENFKRALEGESNKRVREIFTYFIDVGNVSKNEGRFELRVSLMNFDECDALGIAAWDNGEYCTAAVTHDLSNFYARDLTALITKIRLS